MTGSIADVSLEGRVERGFFRSICAVQFLIHGRRLVVAGALLSLAMSGCSDRASPAAGEGGASSAGEAAASYPLRLGQALPTHACASVDPQVVSPSTYELPGFRSRLHGDGEFVVTPMDVDCVRSAYGDDGLRAWSARGDAVAAYVQMVFAYEDEGRLCADGGVSAEEKALKAYELGKSDPEKGALSSRVPEAYYSVGLIRIDCDRDGYQQFVDRSLSAGYLIQEIRPD